MTPNWRRTASNAASPNGSASASACLPADPGKTWLRCCEIEHCLIYVARDYRHRFGECANEHAVDDAGPRGDFPTR